MKVFTMLRLTAALALLVPSIASAELAIEKITTDDGLALDVRLDGAPETGTAFSVKAPGEATGVRGSATARPQDLWLLVDSSTFCQAQKVDGYVNRLVRAVRKAAAPSSRFTLVTYTSETTDVLLQDATATQLEEAQVQCERRPMSSSFDAPLSKLLASTKASNRPLAVWVFTAGNLELSRATAQALVARGAELDVILYNAFIEKELRPMWAAAEARLGGLPARFSVLAKPDGAVTFPSQRFTVEFAPKNEWLGLRKVLEVSAAASADAKAPVLAKTEITAELPLDGWARFWRRFGKAIVAAVVLASVAYVAVRLVRYYRAPRCAQCERRVSFRAGACLFCTDASTAYLVGEFRRKTDGFGRGPLPTVVLPLVTSSTEVGTHRKSVVQFPKNGRREAYFQIHREVGTRGPRFRLVRKSGRRVDVRVNGVTLADARYLANGDAIQVGATTMVFRYGGEAHA